MTSSHSHADGHKPHTHDKHEPHAHDYVAANKEFYDENLQRYEDPRAVELARRQVAAIKRLYSPLLDEDSTTVLDFACGAGVFSRELCQYVKSLVGVDISQNAVDEYNRRASNQGLAPDEMRAVCAALTGAPDELGGAAFDVVACASAYHHFPSVKDTTRVLAFFLRPGGTLLVSDILKAEDGSEFVPPHARNVVAHTHGFSEAEMRTLFEGAGLTEFAFEVVTKANFHGKEIQIFLAKAVKPL